MYALKNLWNAFGNLATAINGLANIVNDASNRVRMQLDYAPPAPALPHNGDVIDNAADSSHSTKRNGRSKATA